MDKETKKFYLDESDKPKDRQWLNQILSESVRAGILTLYGFRSNAQSDEIRVRVANPRLTRGVDFFIAVSGSVQLLDVESTADRDLVMTLNRRIINYHDVFNNLPEFLEKYWPQLSDIPIHSYPFVHHPGEIRKIASKST